MSPLTSPDDHSPVKPASSIECNETIKDADSNIDSAEGINSDAVMLIKDINGECKLDKSYRPEFMEMDGTYDHNIKIPLTFTYSVEPESICNVNEYDGEGPVVKTNVLNHFKDGFHVALPQICLQNLKGFSGLHSTMQHRECMLPYICHTGKTRLMKLNHQYCYPPLLTTTS